MGDLGRFALVQWPAMLQRLFDFLDVLIPDVFAAVPAECIGNRRYGFYWELSLALSLPLLCALAVGLLALLVFALRPPAVAAKRRFQLSYLLRPQARFRFSLAARCGRSVVGVLGG